MKPAVFILTGLLSAGGLYAQVPKGTVQLGPEFSYRSAKQENVNTVDKFNGTTADLTLGYAFADNKVIGISGGLNITNNGQRFTTQELGVFYRRYYALGQRFAWFIQPSASVGWGKFQPGHLFSVAGGFGPGISFLAKTWLQLDLAIPQMASINYYDYKESGIVQQREENFGFGLLAGSTFSSNMVRIGARFNLK